MASPEDVPHSDQGNMAVWGHPDQWQGRDSDERERALRARVARLESGLQTIRDDERLCASYMRHIASVALDEVGHDRAGRRRNALHSKAELVAALEAGLGPIDTNEAALAAIEAVCQALGCRPDADPPRKEQP
jgi:hypothetical protein